MKRSSPCRLSPGKAWGDNSYPEPAVSACALAGLARLGLTRLAFFAIDLLGGTVQTGLLA